MTKIETMLPSEVAKDLRAHGVKTSAQKVRAFIENGAYPFGKCCYGKKQRIFEIYKIDYENYRDNIILKQRQNT